MMTDKNTNYGSFYFSFDEGDEGINISTSGKETETELLTWPYVLQRVVDTLERVYGYDIKKDVVVKGVPLEAYERPSLDAQMELDFNAGLTD